jgi:DNA-binding CsgD family transcriptional regulator
MQDQGIVKHVMIGPLSLQGDGPDGLRERDDLHDIVRSRQVPVVYAIDGTFSVRFSCGVPNGPDMDVLPPRIEQIVRCLTEQNEVGGAVAVDGDTVVRVLQPYCPAVENLTCVIVEKLRARDPISQAVKRYGITPREAQVLRLVLGGAATAAVAAQLHIAETTARDHLKRIAAKTSCRSRAQIVARVLRCL